MTPTYTNEFREAILTEYIGFNLVAFLVSMPSLGVTDSPTPAQLQERLNLTMTAAVANELPHANGYSRQLVYLGNPVTNETNKESISDTNVEFISDGGDVGPFTHIVFARGANLSGADPALNGNHRGDITGTVVRVEPVVGAPLVLPDTFSFLINPPFVATTRLI